MTQFDSYTIEPDGDGEFSVYGHGVYEQSSVLAGQPRRSFLDGFETVEAAQKAYPTADVTGSTRPVRWGGDSLADYSGLPSTAPSWFDPCDAGERWDDDY